MIPIRPLLKFDWSGAVIDRTGLAENDLDSVAADLNEARREVGEVDQGLFEKATGIPSAKQPLDAGFFRMPERILEEYHADQEGSELGRILAAASRISQQVDRVVLLGIGGSYMGARALMESCCHPYHNQLNRSQRGARPQLYFEGNNVDNDATAGLLDLLDQPGGSGNDEWAIIVISKSGGTLETAAAFRQFLTALTQQCGGDVAAVAQRVIPVTGETGKLADLSQTLGFPDVFRVPDGVGGRFSILSPVGLLPAAVLGIDVVQLLEGAVAMNEHFMAEPVGQNVVLDYVGVSHLMEVRQQATLRVLSVWAKALESVGLWYDQLLAESLGKQERGATPLTVVNTRDLHSRAQQHQEGTREKLITNLIVEDWRRDALPIGRSQNNQDGLNEIADRTLPEIMAAAIDGTNQAYREDGRSTTNILMPMTNEHTLGQLFQMFMLATVVEGRLLGINPYGQPGVEAYKKHMKANLDLA